MNPKKQRIAIAEACGWEFMDAGKFAGVDYKLVIPPHGLSYTMTPDAAIRSTPDYLNDLNAMHEAEKVLTSKEEAGYFLGLQKLIVPPYLRHFAPCIRATASQRAEAFLRTIGKWEDKA